MLGASLSPARAQDPGVCSIYGTVVDAQSGEGVAGASIWLERSDGELVAGRATSAEGAFAFELRSCRPVLLRVEMLGFEVATHAVGFDGGPGQYQVTVRMTRAPLKVEELRVVVPKSLRLQETGFYARKAWVESTGQDLADFYDPDEVEGRSRVMHTVSALALSSRIRFLYKGCRPSVYIDGRRIPGVSSRHYWGRVNRAVTPSEVEGIEVYRAMSTAVPEEFRDYDSTRCGAVVVWTKRGSR